MQLQRLRNRLQDRKITLHMTEAARSFVAEAGYDPVYGARPLKRYIQHNLETTLARRIISSQIREGQSVTVDVVDGALQFVVEKL